MGILKPTFFPSVPRLYNKIYGKINDGIQAASGIKGWLARKAVTSKLENLNATGEFSHKFYDALVFKKARNLLGG